ADLNCSESIGALPTLLSRPNDSTHDARRALHCGISVPSMSALGHSRPVEGPPVAGACPLRSESGHALASSICPLCAKSDLTQCSKLRLLDHLVGPGEERRWHVEAHRLAVLQVDHQVKLGRPLNRRRGFDPSSLCRLSSHTSLREEP